MRADEITDEESFKAWLNARPEDKVLQDIIALSTRLAFRVFPFWVQAMPDGWAVSTKFMAIPVVRMVLSSSLVAIRPTNDLQSTALKANGRGTSALLGEADVAFRAHASSKQKKIDPFSAHAAAAFVSDIAGIRARFDGIGVAKPHVVNAAVRNATNVATFAGHRIWRELRADCYQIERGQNVLEIPLWAGSKSEPLATAWQDGRGWMQSAPGHAFWIRWYEAVLAGRPLTGDWDGHWQLLHDIALIPDADWQKGAEHVAGLIEEIECNYAREEILKDPAEDLNPTEAVQELERRLPLNESVAQDTETKRFYLVADRAHDDPTIETLLEQVEDNLDDCLASHNGIRGDDRVTRVVRRVLSKYREKPLRIEMDFTDAIKGFRSNLTSGEYDKTDDNAALLVSLEDTVRLVRKTHPEVAEVRDHLAQVEMSRLSGDDKAALAEAKEVLVEASKGELAEDFGEDIPELLSPVLPSAQATGNAPSLPGASRTFSRAAKMLEIVISQDEIDQKSSQRKEPFGDRTGDLVRKIDNSAAYKGARIVGTAGSLAGVLWAVVQIGLRVLTVL